MKNIRLLFLLGVVAAVVSCNNQIQSESTELASPVTVENVTLQSISQFINTTGTARAASEVVLATEMRGKYKVMNNPQTGRPFKLGDKVKTGQVIIHLDDEEYVNSIGIETIKLDLEISKDEYKQQQSLLEKGGATQYDVRNSEVAMLNAEKSYESALINLAKMDVIAPFNGIIVDLPYFTSGTFVASGADVATLMSYGKMYLDINLPEKNLTDVSIGQKALITSYTLTEDTLIGSLSELSPMISSETRTFKGTVQIDNPQLKLRPGMFVKADIVTSQSDSTIVIPKNIVMSGRRGRYVFIVGGNNSAEQRNITIGLQNQDFIEVVDGLEKNDRLIVEGFETLRNRSKVRVEL